MRITLFTLAGALLLAACSTVKIHDYSSFGDTQVSPDQIAILHVPYWIKIHEIDGTGKYHPSYISAVSPYSGARIQLLAGRHTVAAVYSLPGYSYSKGKTTLGFTAEAGQEYFIVDRSYSKDGQSYVSFNIYACGSDKEAETNASISWQLNTKNPACPARQE